QLEPAPGTHRSVILGPSNVMGWGVGDGETFEALVEEALNDRVNGAGIERVEILNFGVPGYKPPQQLVALEKAMRFSPDAVIYVAVGRELSQAASYLVGAVRDGITIPYQPLADIVERAGVTREADETDALRRLTPHESEILSWIYRRIVETSRAAGAKPVLVFLPQVREGLWAEETAGTLEIAEDVGFIVVDLADLY